MGELILKNKFNSKYWIICIAILLIILSFGPSINALNINHNKLFDTHTGNNLSKEGYIDITVEEAWNLLNDTSNGIQIPIDVRMDQEWSEEHINTPSPENPRHHCLCAWDNETILQEFISIYEGEEIIIYCRSGSRSLTASNMLIDNGFIGTIYNMLGGINAWKTSGYPVISNQPPDIPEINGPTSGKVGEQQDYTIVSNDTDNDTLFYRINWSDGTNITYIGPYNSNEEIQINHTWEEKRTYIIKVKAVDYYQDESDWATLEVSIPKNKIFFLFYNFPEWLFERFPLLEQIFSFLQ
jgi:rhodanese-related sulfurtransferase